VRAGAAVRAEHELVAAGDAARRMNEYRVTDRVAFGIERLLDDKRPFVTALREDRASAAPFEGERELRAPAVDLVRVREVHIAINVHLRIILRAVFARPAPPCRGRDRGQ